MSLKYFLVFLPVFAEASLVSLTATGYDNVLVNVEDIRGLNATTCAQLRNALQVLMNETSAALCTATGSRSSFAEVTVLLPPVCTFEPSAVVYWSRKEKADFVIGPQHPIAGKNPITLQYGGCGHSGLPTYIPIDFVLTETRNKRGEQLVHEWAHYRYGVFDESGYQNDPVYPNTYSFMNRFEPNSCTDQPLNGQWNGTEWESLDEDNLRVESSLMYRTDFPNIKKFCTSENHNVAAPNKQNLLCDAKSVSEVIFRHPDFSNATVQREFACHVPTIKFATKAAVSFFIILDTSPSMGINGRWKSAVEALTQFLWFHDDNIIVSLLTFNETFTPVATEVELNVTTKNDLIELLNKLGPSTQGSSVGLSLALSEAARFYDRPMDVLLLTATPFEPLNFDDIVEMYRIKKMAVHVFSFGAESFQALRNLTFTGNYYQIPDWDASDPLNAERNAVTLAAGNMQNIYSRTVKRREKIFETGFNVPANKNVSGSFVVDASGEKLVIAITCSSSQPDITLSDDSGSYRVFRFPNNTNTWLQIVHPIKENPHRGLKVSYSVETFLQSAIVSINAWVENSDTNNYVTVNAWTSSVANSPIDASVDPVIIYAQLTHNKRPVINATVNAVVYGTQRNSSLREIARLPLLDSGDFDLTEGDGIYTGLVTNFSVDVKNYAVVIEASGDNRSAFVYSSYDTGLHSTSASHISGKGRTSIPSFTRIIYGTDFTLKNALNAEIDKLPPAKISDLSLNYTEETRNATLMWTQPRDNYGTGLPVDGFVVTVQAGLEPPQQLASGSGLLVEEKIFYSFEIPEDIEGVTVIFRVRAYDRNNNSSPFSNPVALYVPSTPVATDVVLWALVGTGTGLSVIVLIIVIWYCCCRENKPELSKSKTRTLYDPDMDFDSVRRSVRATMQKEEQGDEQRDDQAYDNSAYRTESNQIPEDLTQQQLASNRNSQSSSNAISRVVNEEAVFTVPLADESYPQKAFMPRENAEPYSQYANLPGGENTFRSFSGPTAPSLGKFRNVYDEPLSGSSTLRAESAVDEPYSWQDSNSFVYQNSGQQPRNTFYRNAPDPNEVGLPSPSVVHRYASSLPHQPLVVSRQAPPPPPKPYVVLRNGRESPESVV